MTVRRITAALYTTGNTDVSTLLNSSSITQRRNPQMNVAHYSATRSVISPLVYEKSHSAQTPDRRLNVNSFQLAVMFLPKWCSYY